MEEEEKVFLWMGFHGKISTEKQSAKNKATAINQINYGERAGEALRLAKIRPVVAWWRGRERERVFLNIASENVFIRKVNQSTKPMYEYHVPVHSGFDIHEKTNRTIQDMLVYLRGNKIKL